MGKGCFKKVYSVEHYTLNIDYSNEKRENYLTSPCEYFLFLVIGSSPSSIKSSDAFEGLTV